MLNFKKNFKILEKILDFRIEKKFMLKIIKGSYKNRKLIIKDNYRVFFRHCVLIKAIPEIISKKRKSPFSSYPKPTKNTLLVGSNLFYKEPSLLVGINYSTDSLFKIHNEKSLMAILEELRNAVEIVESGSGYYKE